MEQILKHAELAKECEVIEEAVGESGSSIRSEGRKRLGMVMYKRRRSKTLPKGRLGEGFSEAMVEENFQNQD